MTISPYFSPEFLRAAKANMHMSESTILRINHPVRYALAQIENGTHPNVKKSDDGNTLTFNF